MGALSVDAIRRIVEADGKFTAYNSVRSLRPDDGALEMVRFGQAIALRDPQRPELYYNRVLGLSEVDLPRLDALEAFHHDVGCPSAICLSAHQATDTVLRVLRARGYGVAETAWISTCRGSSVDEVLPDIPIRRAVPGDLHTLCTLWAEEGEPIPEDVVRRRAEAQWAPEFPIYLALLDGQVAAMGAMFVHGGVAWLGNASTDPAFRRRGCQRALIAHRLREARAMGCDLMVSDAAFGTVSHRNIARAGMALSHLDLTLVGPDPALR